MESKKNIMRAGLVIFAIILILTEICEGYGYSPYYGGYYNGFGSYGTGVHYPYSYGTCSTYPCLKAKILKKCLELKKPRFWNKPCLPCLQKRCYPSLPLPCIQKPYYPCVQKPCLSCLSQPAKACYTTDTCFKYPPCGPCPYASFQPKCLKHKATLALCS